jgi:hypothetical protein
LLRRRGFGDGGRTLAAGGEALACATLTLGSAEQATALTLNGALSAEIGLEAMTA